MKIAVIGSRDYVNYDEAKIYIEKCIRETGAESIVILSGCCRGADMLGEKYAEEKGYEVKRIKPEWDKFGRAAGVVRNKKIAVEADLVICFWDGNSKGTKITLDQSKKLNKKVMIKYIST